MAVSFNNTNTAQNYAGSSFTDTTNFSVTAGGSNLCAFAVLEFDDFAGGSLQSVTSITYGGRTMTPCSSVLYSSAGLNIQAFYLVNPPTGLNTLVVTCSAAVAEIYANIVSFSNVNQTTPMRPSTYQTQIGTAENPSSVTMTISSATTDLTLSICCSPAPQTTNQTVDSSNVVGTYNLYSDHCTTPASSITDTWTLSGGTGYAFLGFSIQPPSLGTAGLLRQESNPGHFLLESGTGRIQLED